MKSIIFLNDSFFFFDMNKSFFTSGLLILLIAAFAASTLGASVTYSIQMNAFDSTGNITKQSQVYTQQCDTTCTFSNTLDVPQNSTLINYTLSYPEGNYKIYFTSTNDKFAAQNDSVTAEILQAEINTTTIPPAPQLSCTNEKCDTGCSKCEDNNCHEAGFRCVQELTLDKITPESTKAGLSQLNILLRNTGTIDLTNIYAEVSGDGVTTLDKIPMDKLVVGDKDYTFVKINATKPGKIDLVIKISIGGQLRSKLIGSLTVIEDNAPVIVNTTKEVQYNVTELTNGLNLLKSQYNDLLNQYQQKKADGYVVDIIYDKLKSTSQFLTSAQAALFGGDYKIAKTNMEVANESLSDIKSQIDTAVKQQTSTADMIRANILYVGAIAAALVSVFSLVAHFRKVVNKEKLERLKDKVKFAKKDEALTKKDKKLAKEINEIKKVVKKTKEKPAKKESKPAKQADNKKEEAADINNE